MQLSTGLAFLDVEPFPRMKLMKLYYLTLEEIKDLPDKYGSLLFMRTFRLQVLKLGAYQIQNESG